MAAIELVALLFLAAEPSAPRTADLVLYNGKIITVDDKFRIVEALAVRGERIIDVGTNKRVRSTIGPNTKLIDLAGKTVLPGLMDSHVHPLSAAMYEFAHPVPDMRTVQDVLEHIRTRARAVPEGTWIVVRQVFITRLKERRYPTRTELDRAAPRHPVVFSTGPDAVLNSLALKLNGIDRHGPRQTHGAKVERDPHTGEPTGIIRNAGRLIHIGDQRLHQPTDQDRLSRLKQLFADYNSVGITAVSDRSASALAIRLYSTLRDRGELTCRIYCHARVQASLDPEAFDRRLETLVKSPLFARDPMLWVHGIKVFLDGGMLTGSAYMLRPWGVSAAYGITDPRYRGLLFIPVPKLRRIVRLTLQRGLQFTAHTVGDGAVQVLLDAYQAAASDLPLRKLRPCITHCNFMTAEAIEQMARLGVIADMQPAWLYLDGETLRRHFGEARLRYFQPYRSLFAAGVIVGGGSDHMQKIGSFRSINPYNPFLGMWIALVRMPRDSRQALHPEERLTREQAIRLYTINNAYLMFAEDERGSLEVGKLADFIILDRDILTCPVDMIPRTKVLRTYLGGQLVYKRR